MPVPGKWPGLLTPRASRMRNLQVPVRRGSISGCERTEIREFRGSFRAEFAARPFSRIRAQTEAEEERSLM